MKSKYIITSVFSLSGLTGLLRFANSFVPPNRALVLMYHRIKEDEEKADMFNVDLSGLPVSLFEHHMLYLKNFYNVIPLEQLVAFLKGEAYLPSKCCGHYL